MGMRGRLWPELPEIQDGTNGRSQTIRYLKETGLVETRRQYYLRDHSLGPNRYYLPDIGPVPPEGAKFPIKGDFDNQGEWDSDLDDDYWD